MENAFKAIAAGVGDGLEFAANVFAPRPMAIYQGMKEREKRANAFEAMGSSLGARDYDAAAANAFELGEFGLGMDIQGVGDQRVKAREDERIALEKRQDEAAVAYVGHLQQMDAPSRAAFVMQHADQIMADTGDDLRQLVQNGQIGDDIMQQMVALAQSHTGKGPAVADPVKWQTKTDQSREYIQINPQTGETRGTGAYAPEKTPQVEVNVGPDRSEDSFLDKEINKAYGPMLAHWQTGGGSDAFKNLSQLQEVQSRLKSGENLSGPLLGLVPPQLRILFNEGSVDTQQLVEEVVQRNLRQILGAQFTQKEGDRLIARAFNPQAEEGTNEARIARLLQQMEIAAQQMDAASRYANEHGTMRGFNGSVPSMDDFFKALDEVSGGANSPGGEPTDDELLERLGLK